MNHPENPPATPPDTITIHFFHKEELDLMQKCLQAIASGEYFHPADVEIITNMRLDEYANLSGRFNDLTEFREDEFDIIHRAVIFISNTSTKRSRNLGEFLGVGHTHFSWFSSHVKYFLDHWDDYVEESGWKLYRVQRNIEFEYDF